MPDENLRAERAVTAILRGSAVVVVDDPHRENEGDVVIAAEHATAESIAFMMDQCRGLICAPITAGRARLLKLPPMVEHNTEVQRTAFTVSVDAATGITTGISPRTVPARSRCCGARTPGPRTWCGPGTCSPWSRRTAVCLNAPGTPSPPSTSRGLPGYVRRG